MVTFKNGDQSLTVRGFYAADGNASETNADSGNVWKCRVSLLRTGLWSYAATLRKGDMIATNDAPNAGQPLNIENATGTIKIDNWSASPQLPVRDFRRRGRITTDNHIFRFRDGGDHFLKCGANSPENLLAYEGFDDTYRIALSKDSGEAKSTKQLHRFAAHQDDWNTGDPTWSGGKGKSLIGAMNYLSEVGMNSVYFLSMNIGGDGKDVWPYRSPDDFSRFDCSKLDQWEILFEHMQRRGLLLHVITQETENERLLDDGNVGTFRKLYYRELIARFAHHPAIIWNLGEENGPANFSPHGQSTEQEKSMSDYFANNDPYGNTVLIHSHAAKDAQEHILLPLLGHKTLDGVSLQVSQPERVHADVLKWRRKSSKSGRPWVISMDEIGPAKRGAVPDKDDPMHDQVRGPVLWGSLMAGAAGVEWYFGYEYAHNDLMAEDWRSRERLWEQTRIAKDFFESSLPLLQSHPHDELVTGGKVYCNAKPGQVYAVYRHAGQGNASLKIDLADHTGNYEVRWLNPRSGGDFQAGTVEQINGGSQADLGLPPSAPGKDWVILINKL